MLVQDLLSMSGASLNETLLKLHVLTFLNGTAEEPLLRRSLETLCRALDALTHSVGVERQMRVKVEKCRDNFVSYILL